MTEKEVQKKKTYTLPQRPKKRLFLGVLSAALLVVSALLYAIWWISAPGLSRLAEFLPTAVGWVLLVLILLAVLCILNMVLAIKGLPYLPILRHESYRLINLLFPVAVAMAKPFGVGRRKLEGSFIATSNLLFARMGIRVPADRLLVVTPHCLQLATCPHKITRDPKNCKRCGGCDIGALVTMSEEMGFHFFVATGGTLARQIVYQTRPKAVLAIACERDLMSGIQDVYPLPAVGVLNIRPNGPCYNTHVDLEEFRTQLEAIILPRDKKEEKDG